MTRPEPAQDRRAPRPVDGDGRRAPGRPGRPGRVLRHPAARPLAAALVAAVATGVLALSPAPDGSPTAAPVPVDLGRTEPVGGLFDFTPPAVPTGLAATVEDGALTVRWNAVSDSDLKDYRLSVDGSVAATVARGTTTTRLTGLTNGREYSLTVTARDTRNNESRASAAVRAAPQDLTPPPVPTGLVAVRGDSTVALSWTAVTDTDRVATRVLRDGRQVTSLAADRTSFTDTGLVNDQRYTYTLVAVDARGNASQPSAAASATPTDLTAPTVPTGLRGTAGDASAALTWDPGTDADLASVRVQQDGRVVADLAAGTTSWTATGLEPGRRYRFALVAVDGHGNTSAASSPEVEVVPLDLTPPGAPGGVVATPGDRAADLSWDAVGAADLAGYEVLDAAGAVVARVDAPARSAHLTGLANDVEVTFRVVALDRAGNRSAPSAPVAVTPVDRTPPDVVTGTAVTALDRALRVTWTGATDAATYRVLLDGAPAGEVAAGDELALVVPDLEGGRTYEVVVVAVDAAGNVSAEHAPVAGTPRDDVPAAPTGVTATAGVRSAEVTWDPAPEDDVVEHRVLVGGQVVAVAPSGPGGAHRVVVEGLEAGVEVELVVVAVDAVGGVSPVSTVVRVTPQGDVPEEVAPPYAPTVPPAGGSGTATGAGLAATRDGRYVVVSTPARLEAGDTNAAAELYLVDRTAGTSRRVAPLPASWRSTSTDPTNASAVALSEDGRYLALSTTARLVAADTNTLVDVYRLDLRSGDRVLVSVPTSGAVSRTVAGAVVPSGSSVSARSPGLAMTADGGTVLFLSARADLVAGDRNGAADVFAKDVAAGTVRRVSTAADGGETPWRATGPALEVTPDGRYAVFPAQASGRPLVLLRKDLVGGGLVVASTMTAPGATVPTEVSVFRDTGDVAVSDDGRYVAFSSAAKPSSPRTSWSTGLAYRRDLLTGTTTALGTGQTASWEHQVGLDASGRFAFLATAAALLPADTNRRTDHYRRDLGTGRLELVTSRSDGSTAPARAGSVTPAEYGPVLVLDADRVLVGTVLPLVAGDANGLLDVYGRDLAGARAGAVVG
ncbi:fibronectin type III domain-containing protein [Pseudokineococcus basanitobsidens]|uniref:Fibronectin type III domain-containing protein n=1 Tax=Pseudokineococcus basanitobsidens TaxID=1926649 RepID=A0ABU8RKB1_9ACTN